MAFSGHSFFQEYQADMRMQARGDAELWQAGCTALEEDWRRLADEERRWIRARLARIGALQERLQALFAAADGAAHCRLCRGACCDRGKYHVTLANLLALLAAGQAPPPFDAAAPCPMLDGEACRLGAAQRPFNCVTFVCGPVEDALGAAGAAEFYSCEKALRAVYEDFARRYAGGGMNGFLLAAARLAGRSPLARQDVAPAGLRGLLPPARVGVSEEG